MVNDFDSDGFSYWLCNLDDDIGFYEQQLKKEYRKNNNSGDIINRYNDFVKYKDSTLARYVEKAVNLLPTNGSEIRVKDLKQTLINSYNLDNEFADRVIKEVGSNHRHVKSRNHSYDKSIDEIRLERV